MTNRPGPSSATPIHPSSPFHVVIVVCCVFIFSYLAARLGGALVLRPEMIWPLWPGFAFLVAVLLLTPRKIWPGDSFISQDVRLTKKFNITETLTLSLIGEVFNLLNIANLTGYSNVVNQPNYGQPSARAGQAFGTGGPRAFQVAARVEF